ncbi:adenylate/guanylate cyclase domain-containing protein [Niveispirillum sp. KHB5.9]|uniref:adenylate/guanylate cyclase domain-containing protein n=1 Tax=Niveispirillum sp. KHB5.9 TaxID=3400269 RepID=UPI003A84710A
MLLYPPAPMKNLLTLPACEETTARKGRMRLPIALVLTLGLGGLMLVAVASVFWLGVQTSGRNTYNLLADKAELAMNMAETRVRAQLDPARSQVDYLTNMLATGQVPIEDTERLKSVIQGALAATPQVAGIGIVRADDNERMVGAARIRDTGTSLSMDQANDASKILADVLRTGSAHWVDPVWAEEIETTVMPVQGPLRRDGQFLGAIASVVGFNGLSRFLRDADRDDDLTSFILFDDHYVLAHPALAERKFDFSKVKDRPPLPTLEEVGDPVAAAIWSVVGPDGMGTKLAKWNEGKKVQVTLDERRSDLQFRQAEVDGVSYFYLLRSISDYGEHPFTLVVVMREEDVDRELERFQHLLVVGFGILIASVLAAMLVGKMISRRIRLLSGAAVALRDLDFQNVPRLPDSRFREVADAAAAFNAMVSGLRWFETYVPKSLVLRLIRRDGTQSEIPSEEREVTVLFTDIKGFSAMAERMSPQDTADWLNRHFTRIAACIEAEGGTVDKFIGDAVMAFWGAPDDQPDHASRALRAALAIAQVVKEEAEDARAAGLPPVCLRVGVHSGPVIVGNIGAATRINYTIVGDTVNTAARLEALGGEMMGDECYVVLVSDDTVTAAGNCTIDMPLAPIGAFSLRGRVSLVDVWRLVVPS